MNAVVRAELALGDGSNVEVVQRIMTRLHEELGKLVGSAGFDVLLARAVVLARRQHRILAGVTAGPGGKLTGIDTLPHDGDGRDDAPTAIITHFIELLVMLVGEDLTMRLVRDLWPGANEEKGRK